MAKSEKQCGEANGWTIHSVYVLFLLMIVYAFNSADRSLFGLYTPLMKNDLQLSDTVIGLLSGFVFTLFYALAGLPIAWLADRGSRRTIISIGFAVWSLATVATGMVQTAFQLGLARVSLGVGEASNLPAGNSMIADLFGPAERPFAMALFAASAPLAMLVGFPLMGWFADTHGWRAGFIAAGVAGLICALWFYGTVKDPERKLETVHAEGRASASIADALHHLFGSRRYLLVLLTFIAVAMNVATTNAWYPAYLARSHDLGTAEIGASVGVLRGVSGIFGTVAGGWITARLGRREPRWHYWVPATAMLLMAPSQLVFLLAPGQTAWRYGLAAESFFGFAVMGPIYALLLRTVPSHMHAMATSIGLFASYLFGQSIGPLLVGFASDRLASSFGVESLRYALLIAVANGLIGACFCFAAGGVRRCA